MGWLDRLFGKKEEAAAPAAAPATTPAGQAIPLERQGLHGEFDQSGLAKRVAAAFDADDAIDDIHTLFVAQTGSTVVLKGKVPQQAILTKIVAVAGTVPGATHVDTTQVTIGA